MSSAVTSPEKVVVALALNVIESIPKGVQRDITRVLVISWRSPDSGKCIAAASLSFFTAAVLQAAVSSSANFVLQVKMRVSKMNNFYRFLRKISMFVLCYLFVKRVDIARTVSGLVLKNSCYICL